MENLSRRKSQRTGIIYHLCVIERVRRHYDRASSILSTRLLLALPLVLLFAFHGQAQTPISPMQGETPLALRHGAITGGYPLGDFDRINAFSGKLDFSFPLLEVNGRGQAKYTIMARIESRPWHYYGVPDPILGIQTFADPGDQFPGLSSGYEPLRVVVRPIRLLPLSDCDSLAPQDNQLWLTRITVVTADGSEIELRDVSTDGRIIENNCFLNNIGINRGNVFASNDGTAMTFISDAAIIDQEIQPPLSGYLLTRDGVRYRIETSFVRWMRDRNGNTLNFTYDSQLRLTKVTDSLAREITFAYAIDTGNDYDEIRYKGFGGAQRTIKLSGTFLGASLRADHQLKSLRDLEIADSDDLWDPPVLSKIELPNGKFYRFKYNSHADLARVELPTGGAFEYDHEGVFVIGFAPRTGFSNGLFRKVTEKRIYSDGVNLESVNTFTPTYSIPPGYTWPYVSHSGHPASTTVAIDLLDSQRRLLARTKHFYTGVPFDSIFRKGIDYAGWKEGREVKTEFLAADGETVLRRVQTTTQQRTSVSWWSQYLTTGAAAGLRPDYEPSKDPRLVETLTTLVDLNKVTKNSAINPSDPNQIGYDQFNNQTDVWEYEFGNGQPGPLSRRTHISYVTSPSYINANVNPELGAHLRDLPLVQQVFNGSNQEKSRTTFEYDVYNTSTFHALLVNRSNISGLCAAVTANQCDNSNPTAAIKRGNVTAVTRSLLTNGVETDTISSYEQYDIAGNVVKVIDPRSTPTNIIATELFFDDRYGVPTDDEARGNISPVELGSQTRSYAFGTRVLSPLGHEEYEQFDYYIGQPVNTEDANGIISSLSYNDSLDRLKEIRRAVGTGVASQTTIAYNDDDRMVTTTSDLTSYGDNKLKTETLHDQLGRTIEEREYEGSTDFIAVRSVPFTVIQDGANWFKAMQVSNPFRVGEQPVFTTSFHDSLDRVIKVKTPDNAVATTSYLGNEVLATDQAGKVRKSILDNFGRIEKVYEDPSVLNHLTTYTYDALDNLTHVTQSPQPARVYNYDSMRRITSAYNPETGTINYEYDRNNNLTKKTDARGIMTTYVFDDLNRLTDRQFSDTTPDVTYTYDAAGVSHSKGRLTSVSSSTSTYNYIAYDAKGRVLSGSQVTDGQPYIMSYEYNLAGGMTSQTYPSGRIVTSEYDDAGRLAGIKANGQFYAGGAASDATNRLQYAAHGAVSKMRLGNTLWEHTNFNTRLQPTQIGLGTTSTNSTVLQLDFNYGTTQNNGNLQSQTITMPGLSLSQTYTYDRLNRLETAVESDGASWKQKFTYDRYGNRRIDPAPAVTSPDLVGPNPVISETNNRIVAQAGELYDFDFAGNLKTGRDGETYTYDAANRLVTFNGGAAQGGVTYVYDGDGKRVKKLVGTNSTVFVYNLMGQLVAEYTTGAAGTNGTSFLTADNLGSPRVITDSSGAVKARHDYHPFGEEIGLRGGRSAALKYVSDNVRQKFTSLERDTETSFDFAQTRYYSNLPGRFTSPDEPFADQEEADPQSWNLYAYARNNPLRFIDPTGLAHYDANGNYVGDKDGECDKELGACWRVDPKLPLGGYWDFGGDKSAVTVIWSAADEAALQQILLDNDRMADMESDPDCEGCVYEMGGGGAAAKLIIRGAVILFKGRATSRLDKAMRARGFLRYVGQHAHHIVAQSAARASKARRILRRFKIDVNSADNGVYLNQSIHQGLHTNAYYAKVELMLRAATTKEEAIAILSYIGSQLQKGTFMMCNPKLPC